MRAFGELMLIPWYGSAGTLSVRRDGVAGQNGVHDYGARACAPGVATVARLGEDDWQAWREVRWPRWLLLRAGLVPPWNRKTSARRAMRVFVTGATGALGRYLVPGLVAAGYEVTATTRTPGKAARLGEAGAEPVVVDGLDREAVVAAVRAASPGVIVHEMTALAGMRSLRNPDKAFAVTNELRTRGTDNLLAAAARAGTRRVIAQSYAGAVPDKRSGGALKTEADPPDLRPVRSAVQGPAAIAYVDKTVPLAAPEGIVLRYGSLYGAGRLGFPGGHGAEAAGAGDRRRDRGLVVHRGHRRGGRDGRGGRPRRAWPVQRGGRRPGSGRGVAAVPGPGRGREAAVGAGDAG